MACDGVHDCIRLSCFFYGRWLSVAGGLRSHNHLVHHNEEETDTRIILDLLHRTSDASSIGPISYDKKKRINITEPLLSVSRDSCIHSMRIPNDSTFCAGPFHMGLVSPCSSSSWLVLQRTMQAFRKRALSLCHRDSCHLPRLRLPTCKSCCSTCVKVILVLVNFVFLVSAFCHRIQGTVKQFGVAPVLHRILSIKGSTLCDVMSILIFKQEYRH